ncbi:MAG: acyl-CoA thioesterase [Acidobacteriia bacterium]|nr:acyl-CoA thioesterase [Terriglobia bacterium]
MAYEYHYRRKVYWQDTDMAGIIHFTNYFRYMEEVEIEFLSSLDLDPLKFAHKHNVWRPRVSAQCDFKKTVSFGDELDIHIWVVKKGRSSIHYELAFNHDGEEVAHGRLVIACVSKTPDGVMQSTPIPPVIDEALQVAPFAEVSE